MKKRNVMKSCGGFLVIGILSFLLGCMADYPVREISSMPLCDCKTLLQAAQKVTEDSGYNVLQADPDRGFLILQKKVGKISRTLCLQVWIDKDNRTRMHIENGMAGVITAPPVTLTRIELVNLTKMIANQMGFSENDVFVQFFPEQKPLLITAFADTHKEGSAYSLP